MSFTHQSEMVTLGKCERQWWYRYVKHAEEERAQPSKPMVKGTLWHSFQEEWWVTDGGIDHVDWANVLSNMGSDSEYLTEDVAEDVTWMAERYDKWRGGSHLATEWEIEDQEVEITVDLFGIPCGGRFDGIVRHKPTNTRWLLERKTMRDWRRLDYLSVDPQLTHYLAMADAADLGLSGVLYEAAKTYRWTRDEHKHPPEDSFQEHTVIRSPGQLAAYEPQLHAFDARVRGIRHETDAVPNIGSNTCSFCEFKDECWGSLQLSEPDVEWEE